MAYRNREEDKLERREEQTKRDQQGKEPDDKPKKSWREVDQQRDGARTSSGGGNNTGMPRGKAESAGYRSYKSKLDKLFDGKLKIDAPTEVEVIRSSAAAKPAPVPLPVEEKVLTPRDRLRAAESADDTVAAAKALLADGGLPLDTDLLLKVLNQDDGSLYLPALETLLDAMEKGRPKNAKAIVARLDILLPTLQGDQAATAKGIRSRLGG